MHTLSFIGELESRVSIAMAHASYLVVNVENCTTLEQRQKQKSSIIALNVEGGVA